MNLKITKKLTIIFISILLFFTFCSRTIHYLLVPKVMAEAVVQGNLTDEYSFSSGIEGYFFTRQAISIDENLNRPLYIKEIHVDDDDYVRKGDPLITFNTYEYQSEIKAKKTELENLEVQYSSLQNEYNSGLKKLTYEANDLQNRIKLMEKSDFSKETELYDMYTNIYRLKEEYDNQKKTAAIKIELYNNGVISLSELKAEQAKEKDIQEEILLYEQRFERTKAGKLETYKYELENKNEQIDFIRNKGIFNQKSIFLLAERVEEARNALAAMEKFKEDFQLVSPSDGVVQDLDAKINEQYRGMNALGYVADIKSEQGLRVQLDKERHTNLKKETEVSINLAGRTIKGEISQILKDNEWYMIIRMQMGTLPDIEEITGISIKQSSSEESNHLLIPCSALVQASSPCVYLLKEKKTFFGKEYYVQKKDIRVVDSNDKYISVGREMTPNDIVVTGWDRELKDGETVELLAGQGVR